MLHLIAEMLLERNAAPYQSEVTAVDKYVSLLIHHPIRTSIDCSPQLTAGCGKRIMQAQR
jgi:hypothetical protein